MIISASRRTDIPALYSDWFMNRVRAGFLATRNPFNRHQIREVSLRPEDVAAIIFWTRNPLPLFRHLDELDRLNPRYCFLYTITGYPRLLERRVPELQEAIDTFQKLSELLGPERVVWRYDPVLLSSVTDSCEHRRLFAHIGDALKGHTRKVIVSFADIYKKVATNLTRLSQSTPLRITDIRGSERELRDLAAYFSHIACRNGMRIQTCAETIDLSREGIEQGKCIDDIWLRDVFKITVPQQKDKGQRDACGCVRSVDIGAYNTCPHGCQYCYANFSEKSVTNNVRRHDAESPFLIGTY